jgi:hypothetical protein
MQASHTDPKHLGNLHVVAARVHVRLGQLVLRGVGPGDSIWPGIWRRNTASQSQRWHDVRPRPLSQSTRGHHGPMLGIEVKIARPGSTACRFANLQGLVGRGQAAKCRQRVLTAHTAHLRRAVRQRGRGQGCSITGVQGGGLGRWLGRLHRRARRRHVCRQARMRCLQRDSAHEVAVSAQGTLTFSHCSTAGESVTTSKASSWERRDIVPADTAVRRHRPGATAAPS